MTLSTHQVFVFFIFFISMMEFQQKYAYTKNQLNRIRRVQTVNVFYDNNLFLQSFWQCFLWCAYTYT